MLRHHRMIEGSSARIHPARAGAPEYRFLCFRSLELLALLLWLAGAGKASAEVWKSTASGNWLTSTTWTNNSGVNGVPAAGDTVNIKGDNVVTVNGSATCANLVFSTGSSVGYVNFSGTAPTLNVTTRLDVGNNSTTNTTHAGVLTFTSDATVTAGQCYLNKHMAVWQNLWVIHEGTAAWRPRGTR
jgi:hypothetical protein